MADPLSIAASVAGLASLAGQVFKTVIDYSNAVKDAKLDVTTIATELRTLSGMLHNLSLLAITLKAPGSNRILFGESQIINLTRIIKNIEAELNKAKEDFDKSRLKGVIRSLRWPFSKSDIDKMIGDLRAHKATINLALSADTLEKLAECLELQKEIRAEVVSNWDAIEALHVMHARVKMDSERQKTVDYFLKVNPQPMLQTSLRLRKDATGGWLFNNPIVMQWMSEPNSKLWLSGLAGSGKTVLAGSVIERVLAACQDNMAVAFFFCDYKNLETQKLGNILSSLALQIGLQKVEAFEKLQNYYGQLHPLSGLPRQPETTQLVDIIGSMSRLFEKVVVIVDALDECIDDTREVVGGIAKVARAAANISIALFGRNEDELSAELLPEYQNIEIAAQAEDLGLYVGAEMTRRPALSLLDPLESNEIRQKLIAKANGMFRWVACQLDYLEGLGKIGRKNALDELPPTLNETYDRILLKSLSKRGNSFAKEVVRKTLHWLCLDRDFLTIAQLCEALSIALRQGRRSGSKGQFIDEKEIARYCSSLIRKTHEGDRFELAHFTVKEYLYAIDTSSKLREFRYSESEAAKSLTVVSLECVLLPDFGRPVALNELTDEEMALMVARWYSHNPFYSYAVSFWIHQPQSHGEPSIRKLLKDLFGQRKKAHFQNWLLCFACQSGKVHPRYVNMYQDLSPLHVAALFSIPWLCEWLLQSGANVNATTSYKFSAIHFALIGPKILWISFAEDNIDEFRKKEPLATIDATNLMETIDILLQNNVEITETSKDTIGTLALEASATHESEIPFMLLLNHAPEQCLTQKTLDRIKFLFDDNEPDIDDPFHEILQGVLDMEYQFGEDAHIMVAVRFVQELLRSGSSWDTYSHYNNNFLPASIRDEEFESYVRYAASQNRAEDITRLFEDDRFKKNFELEDGAANISFRQAFMRAAESDSSDVVKVLFKHGFKPLDKNVEGNTIWHIAAGHDSIGVLLALLDNRLNVQDALRVASENGRTPFAEAMFYSRFKAAELLLDHCGDDPAFFRSQPPVLHLSVRMSSQPLFQKLITRNLPGMDRALDGSTPLHFVRNQCNNDFLRELVALYHTDYQRLDGKVAFQTYMTFILDSKLPKRFLANQLTSAIKILAPTNCKVHHNNSDVHIWRDFCQQLGLAGNLECSLRKSASFLSLVTSFRDARIIESYEQQYQQSALVPLLENLESLDFHAGPYRWEANFVQKAIEVLKETSTNRPLMAQDHPAAIALLTKGVRRDYYPIVRTLIDIGTPVHLRVNGNSPLEMACTAGSDKIFDTILECVDLSVINGTGDTDPEVLCRLITAPGQARDGLDALPVSLKLTGALIYGAPPDSRAISGPYAQYPAIVIASMREQYNIVDFLRKAGADILARGPNGWDLTFYYIVRGRTDLLRGISNELERVSYDWTRGVPLNVRGKSETFVTWQGCTALHVATWSGSTELIEYLLQNGLCANVNITSAGSHTPLHVASATGHVKVIECLVTHGADINAVDDEGNRPIDLAFMNGLGTTVELLRQLGSAEPKGDNEDQPGGAERTQTKYQTALSWLEQAEPPRLEVLTSMVDLQKCLQNGDLAGCQNLVATGCPLDRPMPSCGPCDALTYAVLAGWEDIITWLLSIGVAPQLSRCTEHKAPSTIHVAVWRPHLSASCLSQLFDGALETGHGWHFYPLSPLHLASLQISTSALEAILGHIDNHVEAYRTVLAKFPRKRDSLPPNNASLREFLVNSTAGVCDEEVPKGWQCELSGMAPLHVTVFMQNLAMVNMLLDAGAQVNIADNNGTTPLIVAVLKSNDDYSIVECLLNHGADINQREGVGYSPIMVAARRNYIQVAKCLVERGASLDDKTPWGQNLLHLSSRGALQCFVFFHQQGCDSTLSEQGESILHVDARNASLMMPYILNTRLATSALAMKATGDYIIPYFIRSLGPKLLHRVLRSLPRDQALRLLNTRQNKQSPLCEAISMNSKMSLTKLIDFGADIEIEGSTYGTPLLHACAYDKLDMVRELVRRGARLEYVGQDGVYRSAVGVAKAFPRVVGYLIASRFWDQPRLSMEAHGQPRDVSLPAGVRVCAVRWAEYHTLPVDQTDFERFRSLENMKVLMRGTTISV